VTYHTARSTKRAIVQKTLSKQMSFQPLLEWVDADVHSECIDAATTLDYYSLLTETFTSTWQIMTLFDCLNVRKFQFRVGDRRLWGVDWDGYGTVTMSINRIIIIIIIIIPDQSLIRTWTITGSSLYNNVLPHIRFCSDIQSVHALKRKEPPAAPTVWHTSVNSDVKPRMRLTRTISLNYT